MNGDAFSNGTPNDPLDPGRISKSRPRVQGNRLIC
jgi:hypothetical protein